MTKRRWAVVGALVVLLSIPANKAFSQEARPLIGNVSLNATVQFLWDKVQADPGRHVQGVEQFRTRRIRLGLHGEISDQVDYYICVAMNEGDTMSYGVYEDWIKYRPVKMLTLEFGSFLPPWTLEMPKRVHDQKFIRYPLIVDSGQWMFTPWRQTGMMLTFDPGQTLTLNFGVFNGLDTAWMFMDDNAMKDEMVSGTFTFYPGLTIYLGHWGGRTELRSVTVAPGEYVSFPFGLSTTNTGATPLDVGGGLVDHESTWFGLEFDRDPIYFEGEALWNRADRDGERLASTNGFQTSLAIEIWQLEALVRYEYYDPNTDDANTGANDELEWTTLGLNWVPAPYVKLMADYIFKVERLDNQRANDELMIQASVSF